MTAADRADPAGARHAVVFGGSGGIGAAFVQQLRADPRYAKVFSVARSGAELTFDLRDEASIAGAAADIGRWGSPDLVIIATGMLQCEGSVLPEKSFRAIEPQAMMDSFAINAVGPALIAKHMLPLLPRDRRAALVAVSARVGSIGDNRLGGWYSYRASKAALNMLVRSLAIEVGRSHPQAIVAALHPGTVDTRLSQPFQNAIPPDRLRGPEQSARAMLEVIADLGPADSGGFFAWDGLPVPW